MHQHMTCEKPRYIFLHYYAIGNTETLAKGLRAALDITRERRDFMVRASYRHFCYKCREGLMSVA
nr:DUF1259 domain-containing protein [Fluoribacter dumoffii]